MNKSEILAELEVLFQLRPSSLSGGERLREVTVWDSMQMLAFIALIEARLGVVVDGEGVGKAVTVDDLIALVENSTNG